jgi:hypothetical protein
MRKVYTLFVLCFCALLTNAQVTTPYTTNTTWTIPTGVTSVIVKVYGGGGGTGGQDCGAGCTNAPAGQVGYVIATYTVTPGDVIGLYPGGKGGDGTNAVSATGGGAAGTNTFNTLYNGGTGGNAGPSGNSGGGGAGGAATLVTINSTIKIVAGGAGGGGGMANSIGSGLPGANSINANGTSFKGGNGTSPAGDGGGGGGGGGGDYGSVGGTVYTVGTESAGNGGFRGNNSVTSATSIASNTTIAWTTAGRVEITYTPVAGTASADQNVCTGSSPADIILSGYAGTIQWQVSTDNVSFSNVVGATGSTLTSAQMGTIAAVRYYKAFVSGSVYSNTITASVVTSVAAIAPAGSGTLISPYLISNFGNLRWISENNASWNKFFTQTANINAANTNYTCYNSGAGWSPIGNNVTPFTGTYNGGGFTISNLFLNRASTSYLGLFGYSGGTIQNLNVSSANITAVTPPTFTDIAILAGSNSGTISGCSVSGTVSGGNHYNGGLVGEGGGSITNSSSTANVSGANYTGGIAGSITGVVARVFSNGTITCSNLTGGIAGAVLNGSLNNAYTSATVVGSTRAGGAVGFLVSSTISNIYSVGAVSGSTLSGGCIGDVSAPGNSVNCFWDNQASGWSTSAGSATGKTTAEMKSWNTFYTGTWDLQCELTNGTANYWGISSVVNSGYPFLSWQGYNTQCPVWNGTTDNTFSLATNWTNSFVPTQGMDIIMSPSAANDLLVAQNWQTGDITFNNSGRKIKLGAYGLVIGGTISGANSTNYIQTNGTGAVKRNISSSGSYIFPVGNTSYNPVTITNNTGAPDDFSVQVADELYANGYNGAPTTSNRVRRTWYINKTNANAGSGVDLAFNWSAGDLSSPIGTASLFDFNGTNWLRETGSTLATSTSLTYTGYTGPLSPFSIAESSMVLPLNWISFTAKKQASVAVVDWITSNEDKVTSYEVEHSIDGTTWSRLATLSAAGNSQLTHTYNFVHASPGAGVNFYRLLQRDLDGRFSYSKIVSVNFGTQKQSISVYPNPVTNAVLYVVVGRNTRAQILNAVGATIIRKALTSGTNQVSVASLVKGIYVLVAGDERVPFIVQ